jgi:hypothetical protein
MRRIIALFIGLVGIGIFAFAISRIFFGSEPFVEGTDPPSVTDGSVLTIPSDANTLVIGPVYGYWIQDNTGDVFAATEEGKLVRIAPGTDIAQDLVSLDDDIVLSLTSSPRGDMALVTALDSFGARSIRFFNARNGSWTNLPVGVVSAAWSPDGNSIAYLEGNEGSSLIRILSVTTQEVSDIMTLHQFDFNLFWLSEDLLYLSTSPSYFAPGSLWTLSLSSRSLTPIFKDVEGLFIQWADDARQGIKFTSAEGPDNLSLIEPDGTSLGIFQVTTIPSKCFVDGTRFACAVPDNIPSGVILPDDYLKRKVYFRDKFVVWDSSSPAAPSIINPEFLADAHQLRVHNNTLYFVNRYDRHLYRVPLP